MTSSMKKESWILGVLFTLMVACIFVAAFRTHSSSVLSKSDSFSTSANGVAVVYLYEPISIEQKGPFGNGGGVEDIIDYLKELSTDSQVKALVLRINSPGGTVGASQELYSQILKFKAKTGIPVVISIGDIGASGAYWVSLAGDKIFANPGSLVGSIGVIMTSYDFTEVQKRYGIGMTTYKSVAHKDLLSSWRKASPEEQVLISDMMQDIQSQFVDTFSHSRHLSHAQAVAIADGRVFTGRQALKMGLIDQLGGLDDAVHYAAELAHIKGEPTLITHENNPMQFFKNILRSDAAFPHRVQLEFSPGPQLQ